MVRFFSKRQLKEIQVYKLRFIAKRWEIQGFMRKTKPMLVELIFDHLNNKHCKDDIKLDCIEKPPYLKKKHEKQKKKRRKKRKKIKKKFKRKVKAKKSKHSKHIKKSSFQCQCCCKREANSYFGGCGHRYCCWICAQKLLAPDSQCPICKTDVKTLIHWYTQERIAIFPKRRAVPQENNLEALDLQPEFLQQCEICFLEGNAREMVQCTECQKVCHENCWATHDCEFDDEESESSEFCLDSEDEDVPSETDEEMEPARKRRRMN